MPYYTNAKQKREHYVKFEVHPGQRLIPTGVAHTLKEGGEWIEGAPADCFHTVVFADGWAFDTTLYNHDIAGGARYVGERCPYVKAPEAPKDLVDQPAHYARRKMQAIEYIASNDLEWWEANVIKYMARYDAKDGLQDLYKARSYLDMKIRQLEGDQRFWEKPVREERALNASSAP